MMGEHERIHPVDMEVPQTAPLVPRNSSKSDPAAAASAAEATEQSPPRSPDTIPTTPHTAPSRMRSCWHKCIRWTMSIIRRPHSRAGSPDTVPVIPHTEAPRRRSCWCKCMCWTVSIILLLLVLLGATIGILYLIFRPKIPKYSVDRLQISKFMVYDNLTVYARFDLTITSRNPNKRIGIYYLHGSNLSVWYNDTSLCSGSLPSFYQGHRNTTAIDVFLTGQTQLGSSVMTALMEQERTGKIPLDLKGIVPVKIKLGSLKLKKVRFRVKCKLVVDSLAANNRIRIRSSSCKFKLRL